MKTILNFYQTLKQKNYTSLSGSITFFFIVNGGSLLFLVAFFFNLFQLDIPKEAYESNTYLSVIINFFSNNAPRTSYLILIFTSIWSSSSLFYHILLVGEVIYNERRQRKTIRHRFSAILLVIVFMIMSLATILVMIMSRMFVKEFNNEVFIIFIETLFLFVIASFVIFFFLLFIPPVILKFKDVLKGYLFTMTFWQIVTILFRIYLKLFNNFKAIYGFLTFIIIGMIYIYMLVIGLVVGLIINSINVKI